VSLFLPLLHHRSLLSVEVQRAAFRELSIYFREDRVRFGETILAIKQFGQEDKTFFLDGRRPVLRKARPLGGFRFPPS